jgi:TRAP-type C4-dicarboxylate transport system permease small subunit
MSILEYISIYYIAGCLSGAVVCLVRLFLPSWRIIKELSPRNEGWITLTISSSIFFGICAIIGPAMFFILRDRESFIKNYVKKYLED